MEKENIIIIPDVHGRTFWKEKTENIDDKLVIFLGDYLDPYPFEDIKKDKAIENFKEIIEFKKSHMNNVILLLGNHDCSYRFSRDICSCRNDIENYYNIKDLFVNNKDLFQLAYELNIDNVHYIFSHGGIHKSYAELVFEENINENEIVEKFNKAYKEEDSFLIKTLEMYSFIRGGWYKYGSIIWASVQEFSFPNKEEMEKEEYEAIQIFGHTQLKESGSIVNLYNRFYDVDSRRCFTLKEIIESELKENFKWKY